MDVKAGYKQTEVGVIPEEWEVTSMAEIFTFQNGVNAAKKAYGRGTPFINVLEVITHSMLTAKDIPGRISLPHQSSTPFRVQTGDVLFNRTSETQDEVGLASVYLDGKEVVFGGFVIRARPRNSCLDPVFSSYTLRSPSIRQQIVSRGQGVVRANIGQQELSRVQVSVPPLREQVAIAEALSDADALIESLEQLTAKKRHLKEGAAQGLLTGNTRLPGFSGGWKTRPLGEVVAHCSSGATPYRGRPEYYKGDIKWITSGELNYNIITDTLERISTEAAEKTNLKLHPAGTFLMAITGLEAAGTRGACGIVGSPATTNQSCMAIYPTEELSTQYLYQYYLYRGDSLALKYCQGTKQQSYTASLVRILPIDLPPTIAEQAAIAAVLSDMDAEIGALEAKVAKARQIKQGMMHNLLTGRIRLV